MKKHVTQDYNVVNYCVFTCFWTKIVVYGSLASPDHHQTITRPERGSSQSGTWKVLIYVTG